MAAIKIGNYYVTKNDPRFLLRKVKELTDENSKYKETFNKLKDAIEECWYMDSENVGEQIFLKKMELKDILKEVE